MVRAVAAILASVCVTLVSSLTAAAQEDPSAITPERLACVESHYLSLQADVPDPAVSVQDACAEPAGGGWPPAAFVVAQHEAGAFRTRGLPPAGPWLEHAAQAGLRRAQALYGMALAAGQMGPADPAMGRDWLERSARQGNINAMDMLVMVPPVLGGQVTAEDRLFWRIVRERYRPASLPDEDARGLSAEALYQSAGPQADAVVARARAFRPAIEAVDPFDQTVMLYTTRLLMEDSMGAALADFSSTITGPYLTERLTRQEAAWARMLTERPAVRQAMGF